MTTDDDATVRGRLDELASAAPPVSFSAADVVRRGRRRRRLRHGAAVGTAAAALALVVAVPTAAFRGTGPIGPDTAAPPTGPAPASTTGTPGPPAAAQDPVVPGLSAAEAQQIAVGCGTSYAGDSGRVNPSPQPGQTPGPRVRDVVRVYNLVRDSAGAHALLYGPGTMLSCTVGQPGMPYNAGGVSSPELPDSLPGRISIDDHSASAGGPRHSGDRPAPRGYETVGGRVDRGITEVLVRLGDRTARVRVLNGTYLARFVHPTTWEIPQDGPTASVTGYDADGRAVARLDGPSGPRVAAR